MKDILGVPVEPLSFNEARERIKKFLTDGSYHMITPINPEKIVRSLKNEKLKRILTFSDLLLPDGYGVIWAGRILGIKIPERITGVDMFESLLDYCNEKSLKVYFLGAREETLKEMIEKIRKRYPNLKISGYHNGYFDKPSSIVKEIGEKEVDFLFVAMGSPKQEYFIYDNFDKLKAKVSMGVGGSFDVFAGKVKRAPKLIRRMGLEWLFRFILQPRKRFPRILLLFKFVYLVLKERASLGKG